MSLRRTAAITRVAGIGGALCGALAVLLGAFGAHALRERLGIDALGTWRTAVEYLSLHAIALLVVAVIARDSPARSLAVATFAFVLGVVLFCGSLFALALGAPRGCGIITPFGGVAFVIGWCALLASFIPTTRHGRD